MEGHLRYRELGPPNSSRFQGNGDGGTPGMVPVPGTAEFTPPTSQVLLCNVPLTP